MVDPFNHITIEKYCERFVSGRSRNPFIPKFVPAIPNGLLEFRILIRTTIDVCYFRWANCKLISAMRIRYNDKIVYHNKKGAD